MISRTFYDYLALDKAIAVAHISDESASQLIVRYKLPYRRSGDLVFITPASLASARKLDRARRREARL